MAQEFEIDSQVLLDSQFYSSDLNEYLSLRNYLKRLLAELWLNGEGFSSKRPFGMSMWENQLHTDLVAGLVLPGTIDANGYITNDDYDFFEVIEAAIKAL